LLVGKQIHFVCLTHPNADHGKDLVPLLERHPEITEFWHTASDISAFIYRLEEIPNFPSSVREFAREMATGWANFLIDLYGAVAEKDIPIHQVRAGEQPRVYDHVEVHALAPDENIQQEFLSYWLKKAGDPKIQRPDPNSLSAVLALRWGDCVILLGADALRANWRTAIKRYRNLNLPKASILKVPHHGASNSLESSTSKKPSYLDICRHDENRCHAVLFAGDAKHPDKKVYDRLRMRTNVHCLINGLRGGKTGRDLGIELDGARPASNPLPCQPVVSFEISADGKVSTVSGSTCDVCRHAVKPVV